MAEYREFQDGELIVGTRYRVVRLIGVGGMGTVYEVEHVELGKRFVLKTLLRELARREDLVIRLRNEWRALGRLEHPNIVNVTDAGTSSSGVPFFVMERLDGETLSQRMRNTRRFPVREAIEIVVGALDGLHAAHQIGVVHRDVKPPNIFVLNDGRTKVLDFGVAKIQDDPGVVTARGVAVGTPRYMSPEQARGEPVDGRADVYSAGLLLFEIIAGVSPFDDTRDANELILAHLVRTPPRLSSLAMDVPPELDQVVARMLAKARDQRPDSARDAANALRQVLARTPASRNSPAQLRLEASAALPAAVSRSAPPEHDTTRPDGVASQRTMPAASVAGSLGWVEQPTLPRAQAAAAVAAGSAVVSGPSTLVAQPWTVVPDSPRSARGAGPVATQKLTVIPAPDAAVTRTRVPIPEAVAHAPTPQPARAPSRPPRPLSAQPAAAPQVRRVEQRSGGAAAARRRVFFVAAGLALLLGSTGGLLLSRLDARARHGTSAQSESSEPAVEAASASVHEQPVSAPKSSAPPITAARPEAPQPAHGPSGSAPAAARHAQRELKPAPDAEREKPSAPATEEKPADLRLVEHAEPPSTPKTAPADEPLPKSGL